MFEEAFFKGLANNTYAKIIDQESMTADQCFKYLETIERKAMAKFESRQTLYQCFSKWSI
jgi:UDP-N-acetylglucosamine:LPS N-acetylglucosamine transferase